MRKTLPIKVGVPDIVNRLLSKLLATVEESISFHWLDELGRRSLKRNSASCRSPRDAPAPSQMQETDPFTVRSDEEQRGKGGTESRGETSNVSKSGSPRLGSQGRSHLLELLQVLFQGFDTGSSSLHGNQSKAGLPALPPRLPIGAKLLAGQRPTQSPTISNTTRARSKIPTTARPRQSW